MSAAGKAKRGAAGVSNAKSNPFRMNGWAPDWQARKIGATRTARQASGGSTLMRGLLGGALVQQITGYPIRGDYERALVHAETRVTHPLLRLD